MLDEGSEQGEADDLSFRVAWPVYGLAEQAADVLREVWNFMRLNFFCGSFDYY